MKRGKEQHFAEVRATTTAVRPILESLAFEHMPAALQDAIDASMEICLRRRRDNPLLRPHLARICYEATGGRNWREQVPIFAAVELLNISTYQSNYCFDSKAGVNSPEERNNQFICSMFTWSQALTAVTESPSLSPALKTSIVALLTRSNHQVYQGQYLDLNPLNIKNVEAFPDLDSFLPAYAQRCDLIAGSTFRACAAASLVNNPEPEILEALFAYLGAVGAAAQVINDLGDFIPYTTKDYAAPFSDLQLGRLTLPTYLLYKNRIPVAQWRDRLKSERNSPDVEAALEGAIKEFQVERQVRELVKRKYFPIIRCALSRLSALGEEPIAPLWFAYPYIFESRLLRYFRKDAYRAWHSKSPG